MKKALAFAFASVVFFVSQSTSAQTVADFRMELEQYSTTHTQPEVAEYANSRILQMSAEAEDAHFTLDGVLLSDVAITLDGVLLSDSPITLEGVLLSDGAITELQNLDWITSLLPQSISLRLSACRQTYVSDLLSSSAITLGVLDGCNEVSSSGFLTCAAEDLAAHAAALNAAQERRTDCYGNVLGD